MSLLEFPILGNPDGRIIERVSDSLPLEPIITQILLRYGDFIPDSGIVEIHYTSGGHGEIHFTKLSPGIWDFKIPPSPQQTLPGM